MTQIWGVFHVVFVAVLSCIAHAYPAAGHSGESDLQNATTKMIRSASACPDPTLAQTTFQVFNPSIVAHALNYRINWENLNSHAEAAVWINEQPAFNSFPTQQPGTVPLFQLGASDLSQFIYMIGVDAETPPVVSGFDMQISVIAWVYGTQVCGSVPLMSAVLFAQTDSYFTINAFEHDTLVNSDGWEDAGVVAFVLPMQNPNSPKPSSSIT